MEDGKRVEIVDLHAAVIQECGEPPYKTCSIMRKPRDVVRYLRLTFCLMEFFLRKLHGLHLALNA